MATTTKQQQQQQNNYATIFLLNGCSKQLACKTVYSAATSKRTCQSTHTHEQIIALPSFNFIEILKNKKSEKSKNIL